jgi:hypothetical protein
MSYDRAMKSMVWTLAAMTLIMVAVAAPGRAADTPAPPPGRVLFVRGDALIEVPGDGKGAEREVARLPAEIGAVSWLEATADGGLVVARGASGSAWLVAGETTWRTGCAGVARPSPTAECVLCESGGSLALIGVTKAFRVEVPGTWRDVSFLGGPKELATLTTGGVIGFGPRAPKKARPLTKAGAVSHFLAAPDGSKGVAVFGHGKDSRVHGFVLDGEGVPRRLGGPGVPVVWSWDSTWVLIEEGSPPPEDGGAPGEGPEGGEPDEGGSEPDVGEERGAMEAAPDPWLAAAPAQKKNKKKKAPEPKKEEPRARVRSCVVRAVGGESKCWNGFTSRSFAPENERVLLWRDGNLYAGKIPGVRPEGPKKIVEKADGPAVWVK